MSFELNDQFQEFGGEKGSFEASLPNFGSWPIGGAAVIKIDAPLLPVMSPGERRVLSEQFEQSYVGPRPTTEVDPTPKPSLTLSALVMVEVLLVVDFGATGVDCQS